jgi:hypothetical protein
MKREDIDWKVLTGSLVTLLGSLLVCGALVGGGYYFERRMSLEEVRNNGQFQAISKKYLAVDEEEKLIKTFYPEFLRLHNQGVIGREQRLDWLEVLRAAANDLRIPSLTYQIKSQAVYSAPFTVSLGKYQLLNSQMTLNMQLLHEDDMLRIFDFLDARAKGAWSAYQCQIGRTGPIVMNPTRPNLSVKCEVNWFTIRLADGSDIKV